MPKDQPPWPCQKMTGWALRLFVPPGICGSPSWGPRKDNARCIEHGGPDPKRVKSA